MSRIELTGLDDNAVVALLEAAAGHTLPDAGVSLAHAVYRETDGNPFFVWEVLRHLSDTGAIYQDATGRWTAEDSLEQMALPDSIRVVITARVGRLGQGAGRVLSVAAVIGRDFDLDLLARATKTPEDELLDVLDRAAAADLVREVADTGRYNFAHAVITNDTFPDAPCLATGLLLSRYPSLNGTGCHRAGTSGRVDNSCACPKPDGRTH